ncbi:hypothetical protein COCMIDRAFT_1457 [Bipolaris oryzae ATCC 44560]|uniref:Uncharacterized protein n=1 Tax=Bipolaris oryzae ATCC 44560 TaxID=930090 RepID=W7A199_COCMI|nr:uncharacterized protein COCMIDRAFT_1457 [Bipolaris oryzae ATCC 44560]EUC49831.1 hypothetical protein COCMIDRAFT_1457 [Bipolaris oryzae ATCC 44560]
MSTERSSAFVRVSDRVAVIRCNSNTLKRRIARSMERGGLGWRGESARQKLAASLITHYAQSDSREDVNRERGGKPELELNEVYERTDSMEPLRREKGVEEKNKESYVGWHILNSREMRKRRLEEVQEMYLRGDRFATIIGREQERMLQHVLRSFADTEHGDEGMTFSSHHATSNEQVKVSAPSSNPDSEVNDLVSNHAHSTAALLRSNPEFNTINDVNITKNECSSEPYPSCAPTSSLAQPPATCPPPSRRPITLAPSTVHSKFSVWPSDHTIPSTVAPLHTNQHRVSPALISCSCPSLSASASSRSRSRSARRRDQRHRHENFVKEKESECENNDDDGIPGRNDDNVEFPPNHPFHGLDARQRRSYWDTLSCYHSGSSRSASRNSSLVAKRGTAAQPNSLSFSPVRKGLLDSLAHPHGETATSGIENAFIRSLNPGERRSAQDTMGRMSEATSRVVRSVRSEESFTTTVRQETGDDARGRKRSGADRLRDTFGCGPEKFTPEFPARAVENEVQPPDVAPVPKKFGMAYLARKMRNPQTIWKRSKEQLRQGQGEVQDAGIAAEEETREHNTTTQTQNRDQTPETTIPEPKNEDTTNENNQTTTTHPVQPPNKLQHTPEPTPRTSPITPPPPPLSTSTSTSTPVTPTAATPRSPSPSPNLNLSIPKTRSSSQLPHSHPSSHQRRSASASASGSSPSSLSDRLRTTRLEDLRLRSETAQEIRNLMLDIDRDRKGSMTFPPVNTTSTSNSTAAATATQRITATQSVATTPELPGGFTVADSPGSGVRGALERHFRVRRESQDGDAARNELRSQASTATLPRSYRAPEVHE